MCIRDSVGGGEGELRGNGLKEQILTPHLDLIVIEVTELIAAAVIHKSPPAERQRQNTVFFHSNLQRVGEVAVGDQPELLLRLRPGQGVPHRIVPLVLQVGQAQLLKTVRSGLNIGAVYGEKGVPIFPIQREPLLQLAVRRLQDKVNGSSVI